MTYLLACNLVVQHIISCNWVLPVGNIFIIIIIKLAGLYVYLRLPFKITDKALSIINGLSEGYVLT
jgi:hypothetical protein